MKKTRYTPKQLLRMRLDLLGILGGDMDVKLVVIPWEVAAEILLHHNGENRALDNRQVLKLKGEILAGEFDGTVTGIAFNGEGKLRNGQHSLTAQVQSKKDVEYVVKTNVKDSYFKYCDINKARTARDVYTIGKLDRGEEPTCAAEKAADASRLLSGFGSTRAGKHTQASYGNFALVPENEVVMDEIIKRSRGGSFNKAEYRAAALNLCMLNPDKHEQIYSFVDLLNKDIMALMSVVYPEDHPIKKLVKHVRKEENKCRKEPRYKIMPREWYAYALSAYTEALEYDMDNPPKRSRKKAVAISWDPYSDTTFKL